MADSPVFFKCNLCGKVIGELAPGAPETICCGEAMALLTANTSDGAQEKHVPVVTRASDVLTVKIGAVTHPMISDHFIQWIYVRTKKGGQRRILTSGETPEARFNVSEDEPVTVYEYCNLHGLWAIEV
ncbi:superoxide reductase [Clostridia bacterium]|nr:superoxide reductase [Clostridia bacterium]